VPPSQTLVLRGRANNHGASDGKWTK